MKVFSKIGCCLGLGAVLALAPCCAGQQAAEKSEKPHPIQVSGCLKRSGNQPNAFVITDRNGITWELVSGTNEIDLSKHIFHVVRVDGKEVPVEAPRHELSVTNLHVLSRSCTR